MKFEADIIFFLQNGISDGWLSLFKVITLLGSWLGFAIALVALYLKDKKLCFAFIPSFLFCVLLNLGIKHIILRPRPFESWQGIINYGLENGYSMPSSHAMCSGIIAAFICYLVYKYSSRKYIKVLTTFCMTIFVILVSLSRMVLGVHYLTDVIVGSIEGVIFGVIGIVLCNVIMKKLNKRVKKSE